MLKKTTNKIITCVTSRRGGRERGREGGREGEREMIRMQYNIQCSKFSEFPMHSISCYFCVTVIHYRKSDLYIFQRHGKSYDVMVM